MATNDPSALTRKAETDKAGIVPPSFARFIFTAESAEIAEETERKTLPNSALSASSAVNFLMTRVRIRDQSVAGVSNPAPDSLLYKNRGEPRGKFRR
jgi:hypothetical protein